MADIVNSQGSGGVQLRGIAASEVAPTVGSEGRVNQNNNGLAQAVQGVSGLVTDISAGLQKRAAAQQKTNENVAAAQLYTRDQDLSFNVAAGASDEEIANSVIGNPQITDDMPPAVKASLQQQVDQRQRLLKALQQVDPKDRQRKYMLAVNRLRTNFIAQYPAYADHILSVDQRADLTSTDIASLNRDFNAAQERKTEQTKLFSSQLNMAGYVIPADSTPEQIQQQWWDTVGGDYQKLATLKRQKDSLDANKGLSDTQRAVSQDALTEQFSPIWTAQTVTGLNTLQAQYPGNPVAYGEAVAKYRNDVSQQIAQYTGIRDPQEQQKRFGNIFGMIDTAAQVGTGQIASGVATTQANIVKAQNDRDFQLKYGKDSDVITKVLLPASQMMGGDVFKIGVTDSPGVRDAMLNFTRNTALALGEVATGKPSGTGMYPANYNNLSAPDQRKIDGAARTQLSNIVLNYDQPQVGEQGTKIGGALFTKMVHDPVAMTGASAWDDLLTSMDSPKFSGFVKAAGVTPDTLNQAAANTSEYTRQLTGLLGQYEKQYKLNYSWNQNTQGFVVDPLSLNGVPPADRTKILRVVEGLSKAGRVMHNGFGYGNNPADALQRQFAGYQ